MHTLSQSPSSPPRLTRRSYSAAFKAQVVAQSQCPGTSIAAVAQAHGINANMVHKWRRESPLATLATQGSGTTAALDFIALPLPGQMPDPSTNRAASAPSSHIEVELHQGKTMLKVRWPVAAAADCATWLCAVLT